MISFESLRAIIAVLAIVVAITFAGSKFFIKRKIFTAKFISRTAVFAAFSIILYITPIFKFKVPFFPSFLEIHFDEIPLMIAGFAYGPWSALFALIVKTIAKLPMTSTMGVGELADFMYSFAFILPASLIYAKHRNIKGALVSLIVGMVVQVLVASFITTFFILDFYINVAFVGMDGRAIIFGAVNKALKYVGLNPIDNLTWPFFLYVGMPFNAFKDVLIVVPTILLYKKTHVLIEKIIK